jgi:hypothetical protein
MLCCPAARIRPPACFSSRADPAVGWQGAYAAAAHSAPSPHAESSMFHRPEGGKRWHPSLRASRSREAPKMYSRTSRTLRICPNGKGGLVRAERIGEGPVAVGTRAVVTRRIGRRELNMTVEIAELDPPRSFAVRSLDGPVRGENRGTIEPLDDGGRSRDWRAAPRDGPYSRPR